MSVDVSVGDRIDPLEVVPERVQLFRYSAMTWNGHRIHYDPEYARTEGHPDVLVQSHFHGALVQRHVMQWCGPEGTLTELSWSNVGRAIPEEELRVEAEVTAVDDGRVSFDVWTETDENRCAEGTATVSFD